MPGALLHCIFRKSSQCAFRQQYGLIFNSLKFHKVQSRCVIQHHIIQGYGEWKQACIFRPWPLNKRMIGSQSRCGYIEEKKKNRNLAPIIGKSTPQPGHYIDYITPAAIKFTVTGGMQTSCQTFTKLLHLFPIKFVLETKHRTKVAS